MNQKAVSWLVLGVLMASISLGAGTVEAASSRPIGCCAANVEASQRPTTGPTGPSDNIAAAAMRRAVAQAVIGMFSPLVPVEAEPFLDDGEFFPNQAQQDNQRTTKPPANNQGPPSVSDLGFPPEQTKPNPLEQARLDKRSRMLKTHQRLGLITAVPLVATVITGGMAGGRQTSSADRDLHAALGSLTVGLYFTTAYFAIFAPKIQGTPTRGPIRLHKALAWIHGPGMILTPVLGEMAFAQKSQGEKVHGIASAHGAVAIVTAGAYGLAILAVSAKF